MCAVEYVESSRFLCHAYERCKTSATEFPCMQAKSKQSISASINDKENDGSSMIEALGISDPMLEVSRT